jgi:hypothetical protein
MNGNLLFGRLLLIYQMPKTGSQTVEATLRSCDLPHHILRVHFLSRPLAEKVREGLGTRHQNGEWGRQTLEQLFCSRRIRKVLRLRKLLRVCGFKIPKVEAICAVREPIGLALSAVFENYFHFFNNLESATLDACSEELLKPREHKFVQRWFELELRDILGIDVYATSFPRETGYAIYGGRHARALVYRFEALKLLPAMLREFLGCHIEGTLNRNIGEAKDYGAAYQRAKQTLRLPADFVRTQCQCRMMQHFYSETERQQFEHQWSEEAAPNPLTVASFRPGGIESLSL